MARVYVSSIIEAPAAKVWAKIRDFNGLPRWVPAVRESRIENGEPADKVGCVREFCTYSIIVSPMPLTDYIATLRLTPVTDGDKTFIEWTAEFECAPEMATELITGIGTNVFQAGFDALKRQMVG
jgi:hypothetical protein